MPASVFATAFEDHSSWQTDPQLETERGVSVGMSVLEMGTGIRYLKSDTFFNPNSELQQAPAEFAVLTWDLICRYGFTENWTFWYRMPFVWSDQTNASRKRASEGKLGDSEAGVLYQFFRRYDPTLSMAGKVRWKLPTGSETTGTDNLNITGTGTTDAEFSFIGRAQLFRYMAFGWSIGYNVRFPGTVLYVNDRITDITNPTIDFGDEVHAELELIGAIDYLALSITGRFTYRFPTSVAMPQYRAETVKVPDPITGGTKDEKIMLYNGAILEEWPVLDPGGNKVSSDGYLFTLTPRLTIRPLDWLDVAFYVQVHLKGKNSIYLMDKDNNNRTFDNYMPMQTLGSGDNLVVGEFGGSTAIRW